MSYIESGDIFFKAYLRAEYAYDFESNHNEFIPCNVIAVKCIQNQAITFSVLLNNGAVISNIPVSGIVSSSNAENMGEHPDVIGILEIWEALSYEFTIVEYKRLKHIDANVLLRNKKWYNGHYMFTITYASSNNTFNAFGEEPSETKNHHMISLNNGNFCLVPNNRCRFKDASFVTEPYDLNNPPRYKIQTHKHFSEDGNKWVSGNNDKYFYDIKDEE